MVKVSAGTGSYHEGMVPVVGATYRRGSDRSPDEQPVTEVTLSGYHIDARPVLNRQFAQFVEAGGYRRANLWTPCGWDYIVSNHIEEPTYWNDELWGADDVPVTGVSWWEALAYVRFAGKALPTEAQWEYACRGSKGGTYPWGEDQPTLEHATYAPGCEPPKRHPTAPDAHPLNISPVGCLDMAGNFAEWCLDSYRPYYDSENRSDPVHLGDELDEKVVRGGCGLHSEDYLRCSSRDCYPPGLRDNLISFRCVRHAPKRSL